VIDRAVAISLTKSDRDYVIVDKKWTNTWF
jgi:hypothetical protein